MRPSSYERPCYFLAINIDSEIFLFAIKPFSYASISEAVEDSWSCRHLIGRFSLVDDSQHSFLTGKLEGLHFGLRSLGLSMVIPLCLVAIFSCSIFAQELKLEKYTGEENGSFIHQRKAEEKT